MKTQNLRTRKEPSGLVTSYDALERTMSILNADRTLFTGEFNQTLVDLPTRVVLEIESYCSSGCRYCSEGKSTSCRRNIPKERLTELIEEVDTLQVHELTIRGGEATEHPYFADIWDSAASKSFLAPNIISNGLSFDIAKVRKILSKNNSKLIISLDGFEKTNSINRNPTQYKRVMEWLPEALREFPEQIVILSCLYRQNYAEIPAFARFLAERGLSHYHLPPLKRLGRSEMAETNFVSLNEMNALQRKLDELRVQHPSFKPVISCIELEKYKGNRTQNVPVPLFNEIYYGTAMKVTPEGDVMVNRGIMFTDKFKNGVNTEISMEPLGSIYKDTIANIWKRSRELRIEQGKLADKHYAYYLGWLKRLD